jgi:hypothetical protein
MRWAGAWGSSSAYNAQDVVTHAGYTYVSVSGSNMNHAPAPGGTAYWSQLPTAAATWGTLGGTISAQADLAAALGAREPTIAAGSPAQYWRGDKTWQALPLASSLNPANYNFTPQAPGGALIQGGVNQAITLAPCPAGIIDGSGNWTQLQIYGGTGLAEALRPTGGTCTSGAASGTIIVTPAYGHSGSWQISSATAGIQEALNSQPVWAPAQVVIPPGVVPIYASITLPAGTSLVGPNATAGYAYLEWHGASGNALINLHNNGCTVRDLFLFAVAGSKGPAFDITAGSQEIASVYGDSFAGGFIGIHGSPFDIRVHDFQHYYSFAPSNATPSTSVISIVNDGAGGGGNYWFSNFKLAGTGNPAVNPNGISIRNGAGIWISSGYVMQLQDGIVLGPYAGDGVANVDIAYVDTDSNASYGIRLNPLAPTGTIWGVTIHGVKSIFNTAGGLYLGGGNGTTAGIVVSDSEFGDNIGSGVKMYGSRTKQVLFHDNYVFGNGYASDGTKSGIESDGAGDHIYIRGNRVGGGNILNPMGGPGGSVETQLSGVSLGAGAGHDWYIENNDISGNVAYSIVNLPTGVNVVARSNAGYNPVGPSTLTCSGSPCTLPATPGASPGALYLAGGTVSSVTRGGSAVCSATPCAVALPPNGQAVVTYSSVPTTITLDVQ